VLGAEAGVDRDLRSHGVKWSAIERRGRWPAG
jgi:hypothetical protein